MIANFSEVDDAIRAFNRVSIAEFALDHGVTWLGLAGPVYRLGTVRARALFAGQDGRHWGDAALVAESLNEGPFMTEAYCQAMCDPDLDCAGLWIYSDVRGRWDGLIAPLDEIARQFKLPAPVLMPDTGWARTWWTLPGRTDDEEIAWAASGGSPLDTNREQL